MKLMMILGGLLGFTVSLAFGLTREGSWPAMLARACFSALILGWISRWWSHLWLRSLQESNRHRREQARQEAARNAAAKKAGTPSDKPITSNHKP